jgi:cob(I)alamin adenosyltransferase
MQTKLDETLDKILEKIQEDLLIGADLTTGMPAWVADQIVKLAEAYQDLASTRLG